MKGRTRKRTYGQEELRDAARTLASLLSKLRKVQGRLAPGSSQRALARTALQAMRLSQGLIARRIRPSAQRAK